MEIRGAGGLSGPRRVEAKAAPAVKSEAASRSGGVRDRVQVSEHARLLELLARVPAVRTERVAELRRLIEAGDYETPERIEGAVKKLLEEFGLA
ncbi:MAG TPA: flagellar biosynthesis anti-sigma factor FlgM [Planctomycetota bacterium]|nr:flagellar biosynthesis anti-sigma factor FlgM [Planctomycetota bacterium]